MLKKILIIFTFFYFASINCNADVINSLTINTGYIENIFYDSTNISSYKYTIGTELSIYPSNKSELILYGDYNFYERIKDLSNYGIGLSFTLIPTNKNSNSKIMFRSNLNTKIFGDSYKIYSNLNINGALFYNYKVNKIIILKSALLFRNISYINSESVKDINYGILGGVNFTLFGQNSFDFEAGVWEKNYYIDENLNYLLNSDLENNNIYSMNEYSFKYSRPISNRTGLNINLKKSKLNTHGEYYTIGYTLDNLSPWASLWEGESISLSIKHIFNSQIVLNANASYKDKLYIDVIEVSNFQDSFIYNSRSDINKSIGFSILKIITKNKMELIPSIEFMITDNKSNIDLYNFNSFALNIRTTASF